jgi:O-antigen/teichoic acid export membrane protein
VTILGAASATLVGRGLILVLTFVAGIIAARILGPMLRGELAVMLAIPSLVAPILVIGLDMANLALAQRSPASHAAVVGLSVTYVALAGLLAMLAVAVVGVLFPPARLGLPVDGFIASAAIIPTSLGIILLGAAEAGRGSPWRPNVVMSVGMVAYVIGLVALLVTNSRDVSAVFLAFGAAQVLTFVGLLAIANRGIPAPGDLSWREYASYGLATYASSALLILVLRADIPLLQTVSSSTQVGFYAVVLPIAEALFLIPAALTLVILPRLAGGSLPREQLLAISRVVAAIALGLAVVMALWAPSLIAFLFGSEYQEAAPVLQVMLPGVAAFAAARLLYLDLISSRRFRSAALLAGSVLAFAIPLKAILGASFGAIGVATGSTVVWLTYALAIWVVTVPPEGGRFRPYLFDLRRAITLLRRARQPVPPADRLDQ